MALTYKGSSSRPYDECGRWREEVFQRITALRPEIVVMSTRTYRGNPLNYSGQPDAAWARAWLDTVDQLRPTGARLVVIADTPDPRQVDIPSCVAANPLELGRCNLAVVDAINRDRNEVTGRALVAAGVTVLDPTPWFCTASICPVVIGNTLAYRDGSHVSATYIRLLAPLLEPVLRHAARRTVGPT
jgi:hypothetical protein